MKPYEPTAWNPSEKGSGVEKRSVQYQKEGWNPADQPQGNVTKQRVELAGSSWNPAEPVDLSVMKPPTMEMKGSTWNPAEPIDATVTKPAVMEMKGSTWNPAEPVDTTIAKPPVLEMGASSWNPHESVESNVEKQPIQLEGTTWDGSDSPETNIKKRRPEYETHSWAGQEKPDTAIQKASTEIRSTTWQQAQSAPDVGVDKVTPRAGAKEWGAIKGLQPPKPIRVFEGVNRMSIFSIKEEHAVNNRNVTSSHFPALHVRPGFNPLGDHAGKVLGIGAWKGKEIHVVSGGAWHRYNLLTGAWTQLYSGLSTNRLWTFVNFRGNFDDINLIASNGVDEILRYDGSTVQPLAGGPVNGDFITTHSNRLYTSVADTVRISALRKAEDWTTINDSSEIIVETSDGKHITGLVAGPGRLVVFKENSIHELYGTSPSNYQMQAVTEKIGTPAGKSAVMINGVLYFLGNDGVYRYSGGSLPVSDFSLPIQRYVDEINKDWIHRSVAGTDGKRFYLAIPHKTATEPNLVLEYDPVYETWNVWEYTSPLTAGFVSMDGVVYGGNAEGKVFEVGGATDDGGAIEWDWESKPFTFESMAAQNRWYRLWIVADVPEGSSLRVSLSENEQGEGWSLVKTIDSDTHVKAQQLLIPVNQVFNSNWMRVKLEGSGPATVYEVTRQERVFQLGQ